LQAEKLVEAAGAYKFLLQALQGALIRPYVLAATPVSAVQAAGASRCQMTVITVLTAWSCTCPSSANSQQTRPVSSNLGCQLTHLPHCHHQLAGKTNCGSVQGCQLCGPCMLPSNSSGAQQMLACKAAASMLTHRRCLQGKAQWP